MVGFRVGVRQVKKNSSYSIKAMETYGMSAQYTKNKSVYGSVFIQWWTKYSNYALE